MNRKLNAVIGVIGLVLSAQAMAQITFYEGEGFHGRVFTTSKPVVNFMRIGFNDRASSVIVDNGRWEVCEDTGFRGHCMLLRPGSYESLGGMGMNNRISSVRLVADRGRRFSEAPTPLPEPTYEYRRRPQERVYNASVTSVHAVVGPPTQRCWVERQQVNEPHRNSNTGGAIVGALVGGILGHQVGAGSGKDIATAGGAVAGAVIGSRVGSDNETSTRDVRHCENNQVGPPEYWDVTYYFQGEEHHVQMTSAPGATIAVNGDGNRGNKSG